MKNRKELIRVFDKLEVPFAIFTAGNFNTVKNCTTRISIGYDLEFCFDKSENYLGIDCPDIGKWYPRIKLKLENIK